jgi:hypothetical protein
MNKRKRSFQIATLTLLTLLPIAAADAQQPETDAPLPGNPLTRMMTGLNPANWNMPKLKMPTMATFLPSKQEKERVITKKDSLVDEVSNTAKQSWKRTKDTLNPMRLLPAGFKQTSPTKTAPKKQGGFFSSLFAPFPPDSDRSDKPSVNDWLKQDPVR